MLYEWINMNIRILEEKISKQIRPIVIEFWAPWCHPCKAMAPFLSKAASKYQDKVDLIRINVDESPDIARSLRILAVPTMIGYSSGKQIFRKTGLQTQVSIDKLFAGLSEGRTIKKQSPAPASRILRAAAGLALIIGGIIYNFSVLLIISGIVVAFTAVYDRCPIYRAVSDWIKSRFSRNVARE